MLRLWRLLGGLTEDYRMPAQVMAGSGDTQQVTLIHRTSSFSVSICPILSPLCIETSLTRLYYPLCKLPMSNVSLSADEHVPA